jgi:acyl-CoA synthetase (AMP-forming)/AMP-acid ligase II
LLLKTPAPDEARPGTHERWREALYDSLRGRAEPAIVFPDSAISAASLWVASRLWVDLFRERGLRAGDRVVLQWPASPGFLAFLIAAIWEGLSTAVIPPGMTPEESLGFFDARLGLGCEGLAADGAGCPEVPAEWRVRESRLEPTADVRLFMRTCGTSGAPDWVALSDGNVWSVLDSHRPRLVCREDVVLSVLPWFHSFGLIIDLLPALLGAGMIVRESSGGKDAGSIIETAGAYGVTWCSMVPLQTQRLASSDAGLEFLERLRGGVVGGASASRQLADAISGTSLFVGYGQTEASPGITLGEPGSWVPGAIGAPLGCEVRVDREGRLHVRGGNVCHGRWTAAGLRRFPADRWHDTGDIVSVKDGEMVFLGRSDHNFKLANGRMVDAAAIESALREADARIVDAAVISPDMFQLRVYVVMSDSGAAPDVRVIERVLGNLADRLEAVVALRESAGIRTTKGALDRLKLRREAIVGERPAIAA